MQLLKIAVATACFGQPLRQSIDTAADLGATGLQFDARNELKAADMTATARRQFLHLLQELGLQIAALTFPTRRPLYDAEQLDARVTAIKNALDFAFQLKAGIVCARIGRIPDDAASRDYQLLCDVLNDIARHANRFGGRLCVIPSRDSAEQLSSLLARVVEGPLAVCFDPAVCVMSGQKPAAMFRTLYRQIEHIIIRDAIRDLDGNGQEVAVGRGEVEWDEFLALLQEAEYNRWLAVDRTQGDDRIQDCRRAVKYLTNVAFG